MHPTRHPSAFTLYSLPAILIGLAVGLGFGACAQGDSGGETGQQPATNPATPVTNEALGITVSRVPDGFRVVRNEGTELVLERTDPEDPGTLEFLVGPPQSAGVNLKEQVWAEKARIESLPGGEYKGQNELAGAAIGTIYTSRGRFTGEDGQPVEEYRALAVHPASREGARRLLTLDYEYPPTERTGERLTQLMRLIEQIRAAEGDAGN